MLSTAIPVLYSFSGGMRANIMTDATQVNPVSFRHFHESKECVSLVAVGGEQDNSKHGEGRKEQFQKL